MDEFFPNGITHYVLGGALIGVGVAFVFILTGTRAGASGVLSAVFGFFSQREVFARFRSERAWRSVFTIGLILGGLGVAWVTGDWAWSEIPWWRMVVGGFLVGLGTRFARGCTSGHGICGLSSLDRASLVHVITFMAVAIMVANVIAYLGRGLS